MATFEENTKLAEIKKKIELAKNLGIDESNIDEVIDSINNINKAKEKIKFLKQVIQELQAEGQSALDAGEKLDEELKKLNEARKNQEKEVAEAEKELEKAEKDHGVSSSEYLDALHKKNTADSNLKTTEKAIKDFPEVHKDELKEYKKYKDEIDKANKNIEQNEKKLLNANITLRIASGNKLNENDPKVSNIIDSQKEQATQAIHKPIEDAEKAKKNAKIKAAGDIINQVLSLAGAINVSELQKELNTATAIYQEANAELKTNLKIFTNDIKLASKSISSSMASTFTGLTSDIREGAMSAANTVTDNALNSLNTSLENQLLQLKFVNDKRIFQETKNLKNLSETVKEWDNAANTLAAVSATLAAVPTGATQIIGAIGGVVAGITKGIISLYSSFSMKEKEVALEKTKMELEYMEHQREAYNEMVMGIYEGASELVKPVLELTNGLWKYTEQAEDNYRKAAIQMGKWGESANSYVEKMFKEQANLHLYGDTYLNKTPEDIAKMQANYAEQTGFAVEMNHDDIMKSSIMGLMWGDETISQLNAGMQLFNHSVGSSNEMFFEMYDTAKKLGISQAKYSKDLIKNLKLAEKHQFKGGVKALMEMSLWAQKTRFNMDNFGAVLDKMKEGGLEGAITSGAQLQVLGGNFAMGADPLAMLYEARMNPEAYAKRIEGMIKGIGSFDSDTGEVKFNFGEQMQLEQMSKVIGKPVEDLMNMRRQDIKREKIWDKITNKDYSKEERELIVSKATLDEDGNWKVNGKDINNLYESDFNELIPVEEGIYNNVKLIADTLVSRKQMSEGATMHTNAVLADETLDYFDETTKNVINENLSFLNNNILTLKEYTKTAYQYMEEANERVHRQMTDNVENVTKSFTALSRLADDQVSKLTQAGTTLAEGLSALTGPIDKVGEALTELAQRLGIDTTGENFQRKQYTEAIGWYNRKNGNDLDKQIEKMRKNLAKYDKGEMSLEELQKFMTDGWDDWSDALDEAGVIGNDNINGTNIKRENIERLIKTYDEIQKEKKNKPVQDGIVSPNGQPMFAAAAKVTPVKDGAVTLAKTDPQDTGLFAKSGGPFDTLFNGIFAKINEVSKILPRSMEYTMPLERVSGFSNGKDTAKNGNIKIDDVKIVLSGKLELSSPNSQTIDIMKEIQSNPMLLRSLSQLISETITKNINGGKSTYVGGSASPRFNNLSF